MSDVSADANAPQWAHTLTHAVNKELKKRGTAQAVKVIQLANLPKNGDVNIAIVPDVTTGATLAFFDAVASSWRKPDGTVIA